MADQQDKNAPAGQMVTIGGSLVDYGNSSLEDKVLILLAQLMEGGQEDEDTCATLKQLTALLNEEIKAAVAVAKASGKDKEKAKAAEPQLHTLIDFDGFETLLGYLDMRQHEEVRACAILAVSTYFQIPEGTGAEFLDTFFRTRMSKGTYDDLIMCFSVAACIFPIVPELSSQFFLREGFVQSLGPLLQRKWKSKKVEIAALEMLNAACMNGPCREAIHKYCTEWLEEMIRQHTRRVSEADEPERRHIFVDGPEAEKAHATHVKNLAAVILSKLQASPAKSAPGEAPPSAGTMSIDVLADMLSTVLTTNPTEAKNVPVEGLAYASLQPMVKEKLASDKQFLTDLIKIMEKNSPRSPIVYGGLSIFANLTRYRPVLSEEQKKMTQLKAYATASATGRQPDPLNDDEHVEERCRAVFEAGVIPMLVTHSQQGSPASLNLAVSIIYSLARTPKLRGQIAQQGGVKLVLHAYSVFPEKDVASRRNAAHALALILISVNPMHVFGGSNPHPITTGIRPLLLLLEDDPSSNQRNLLPVFESLLALANLCSTEDDAPRNLVVRLAWPKLEDLLLSNNELITRASVELICNLVQSPEAVAKFGDSSKQASNRVHLLLGFADSPDLATRLAAGGALASLTQWDTPVNAILERDRGIEIILNLCTDDNEDVRHRGAVCIANTVSIEGKVGEWGVQKTIQAGGAEALKKCIEKSSREEVHFFAMMALQKITGDNNPDHLS